MARLVLREFCWPHFGAMVVLWPDAGAVVVIVATFWYCGDDSGHILVLWWCLWSHSGAVVMIVATF